jgi:hypothetical protein
VQPDSVGDTGPSDFTKAVLDDGSPDAASALTADIFVRGYQRLWMNPAQDQIVVFLYQFHDAAGARAYYRRSVAQLLSMASPRPVRVSVPGLPAAFTTGLRTTVDHKTAELALATKGPILMQIICNSSTAAGLHDRLVAVAQGQYRRW